MIIDFLKSIAKWKRYLHQRVRDEIVGRLLAIRYLSVYRDCGLIRDFVVKNGVQPIPSAAIVEDVKGHPFAVSRSSGEGLFWITDGPAKIAWPVGKGPLPRVKRAYRQLLAEAHRDSPHRYDFYDGSTVGVTLWLDIGAAEGRFTLMNRNQNSRAIAFEADPVWNPALQRTFEPFENVEIVSSFVGDGTNGTIALDEQIHKIRKDDIVFAKIDVEGMATKVLAGMKRASTKGREWRLSVCVYHYVDEYDEVRQLLQQLGFSVIPGPGLMFFPDGEDGHVPRMGLVYGVRVNP